MPLTYSKFIRWQQNRSKATIWMLGKIPLVKGVHVILTKFHNCVLHIRTHGPYRVPQNCNWHACEPFSSCKRQFSWTSPVFVHAYLKKFPVTIRHWKHFWLSIYAGFIDHCWFWAIIFNIHAAPVWMINKGKLCSKIRPQTTLPSSLNVVGRFGGIAGWRERISQTTKHA